MQRPAIPLRATGAAPAVLLAVLVVGAYAQFMGEYFQGGDTWPHIWTSRVASWSDLAGVLSRPIMAGTTFPTSVALFFRPLSSLSYAFDYAVWGMDPLPFHITDLAIHLVATLALFALATQLGLRPWSAAIGAATFTLHPIMASVIPDLPRRHDSLAAAGVVGCLAVAAWAVRRPTADRRLGPAIALAGVLLGLAELAKESAYVGLLLVAPTMVCGMVTGAAELRCPWRRIISAVAVCGLVSAGLFTWRYLVLGGIGGYYGQLAPWVNLDVQLTNLLGDLLWPFRAVLDRTPRAWLTEIGAVVLVAGLPALIVPRRLRAVILYGWLWLLVCGLLQMLTKSVAAWQSYLTVGGFAFLIGGILEGAVDAFVRHPAAWTPGRNSRVALAVCVAGVLDFQVAVLQQSVLLTRYSDWHVAGELARNYLATIRPCVEATPPGLKVMLNQYPGGLDDSTEQRRFIAPGIFGPYSLGPAIYLTSRTAPPVVNDSTLQFRFASLPTEMSPFCHEADGAWWIRVDYPP
jgi:hypothetical protein